MSYKICFKCEKNLPLSAFYKHKETADGHLNKCKECARKDSNENRNRNINRVRKYDRERGNRSSKLHSDAHNAARFVKKKSSCMLCYSNVNIEMHHPNYDKKTWVISLCRKCHRRVHAISNISKEGIIELSQFRARNAQ